VSVLDLVFFMVRHGWAVDRRNQHLQRTALRLAVDRRDADMCRLLLQLGASWSDVDVHGTTPLMAGDKGLLRQVACFVVWDGGCRGWGLEVRGCRLGFGGP
jgi:hypothetical protein